MSPLSPENAIIGLQNALESHRARQDRTPATDCSKPHVPENRVIRIRLQDRRRAHSMSIARARQDLSE